jgi:DNA-binding transcriptional MerR regulator
VPDKNIKLLNISEACSLLGLINQKNRKISTHTLRYWEKEFNQLKPKIIKGRRYYTPENIKVVKKILSLLKEQGLTIQGAKKLMNNNLKKLDDESLISVKADYYRNKIKTKSKEILNRIKKLNG